MSQVSLVVPSLREWHRVSPLSQWPFQGWASTEFCSVDCLTRVMMVWMSLCCLTRYLPRILHLNCIFHFGRMCWYCKSSNLQYFLYIVLFHFGRVCWYEKLNRHCGFPVGPNGSSLMLLVPEGHQSPHWKRLPHCLILSQFLKRVHFGRVCRSYKIGYCNFQMLLYFGRVYWSENEQC